MTASIISRRSDYLPMPTIGALFVIRPLSERRGHAHGHHRRHNHRYRQHQKYAPHTHPPLSRNPHWVALTETLTAKGGERLGQRSNLRTGHAPTGAWVTRPEAHAQRAYRPLTLIHPKSESRNSREPRGPLGSRKGGRGKLPALVVLGSPHGPGPTPMSLPGSDRLPWGIVQTSSLYLMEAVPLSVASLEHRTGAEHLRRA
jgi:hypothetical protein